MIASSIASPRTRISELMINNPTVIKAIQRAFKRSFAIALLAATLSGTTFVSASVPEPSMSIEKKHIFSSRLIRDYMQRRHYVKQPLTDALSTRVLDRYLELLDPDRIYFFQQDISKFNEIRYDFDDYINDSRLEPGFAIFHVYRTRVNKQVDLALEYIKRDFDFEIDEWYETNRDDVLWPTTQAEVNELWRKRVKNDLLSLKIGGQSLEDARETLTKRYEQIRTRTSQLNANDVFQLFINAYLLTVEPHTAYLSPRASANFKIRMSLSLEGIGAVLQSRNEYTRVTSIVPGGPADLSKQLKAGDRIVGVGEGSGSSVVDIIGWRLDDVVERIRGAKDTIVTLRILPKKAGNSGETNDIEITRDKIKLEEQAVKKSILEFTHNEHQYKLGVIDVPTFYADFDGRAQGDPQYRSTTKDTRKLINELKDENIDALLIDLRGNPGGALTEAISLSGLFIDDGPIVQVRDLSGRVRVNRDPDPSVSYTGPLAVMVDRNSASASEIFAGAIQDYQRGVIIGEPTFGKGTVQHVVNLSRHSRSGDDLGQLKLTVAQFFRVNGDSTQHRGVVPDVLFPTSHGAAEEGERTYENALPWTKVSPVEFTTTYRTIDSDIVSQLIQKFDQRMPYSDKLQYIYEAGEYSDRNRNIERVSLNEQQRKENRDQRRLEGFDIENRLRTSLGLEAIDPDAEDENTDSQDEDTIAEDDSESFPPDILLEEAGFILADLIELTQGVQLVEKSNVAN